MGKNLVQQARGKGGPRYKAPSFRYAGESKIPPVRKETLSGAILDIIHCSGHSAPLLKIKYDNGESTLLVAPEGMRVGDRVMFGTEAPIENGNITELSKIPEGTLIFHIESTPGDGGKFARSGGSFARILSRTKDKVIIELPSKKQKALHPTCRAVIGTIAGGGRLEQPILKAGRMFFKMRAKNKLWPKTSGGAQNAVDHPFGNKRTSRKSKARPVPHNAPPGRKTGMLRPRRTGRKRGSSIIIKKV